MTVEERNYVIRTLTDAIGASHDFERLGRRQHVADLETVKDLLALGEWPPTDSTPIELAWLSKPLQNPEFTGLRGYSVFWSLTDDGFAVWVSRTPHKPTAKSQFIINDEVLDGIATTFGFFLSYEDRSRHRWARFRRRFRLFGVPALLLLVAPSLMLWALLVTQELSLNELRIEHLITNIAYVIAAILLPTSWALYGPQGAYVALLVSVVVWLSFLPLKPGWETEGPGLAIVAAAFVAFHVTRTKHRDLWLMSWREILDDRFRSGVTIFGTLAVVGGAVFGVYELLRFAIDEVFITGNIFRGIMIVIVAIGLATYLTREIRG